MNTSIESLPPVYDLDGALEDEIMALIARGKLSPEDAIDYEGWLVARAIGSQAIIGCVGYEKRTENVYMESLVVEKSARKHGVGRQLTDNLFDTVVSPGENLVALTLFWNNDFYRKLGFEMVNAKEIKMRDDVAGREKHRYCTAWMKEKESS